MKMANESGSKKKTPQAGIERKMEPTVPFGIGMHQVGNYNIVDFLSLPSNNDDIKNTKAFASIILDERMSLVLIDASIEVLKSIGNKEELERAKQMISKFIQSDTDE